MTCPPTPATVEAVLAARDDAEILDLVARGEHASRICVGNAEAVRRALDQ